MQHLKRFNEKLVLKDYSTYIKKVAQAYKEAPDFEESEKYRWEILNESNHTFFKRLLSKVNVFFCTTDKSKDGTKVNIMNRDFDVVYKKDDPYASQQEMKEDYFKSKKLYISMDYSEHPVFTVEENIVFRTVHDYIVHILADVDFSGKGEIAAFNAHAKLAPKESVPAIFTEVVGQASYFLTYGNFPKQKITILKGFDYNNVGEVEGCDVVNKELKCNEMKHLKRFNELYDSEESKKELSPEELKKMVAMDFDHAYSKGNWMGENPADLNKGAAEYTKSNTHTRYDRNAILDELYKKAIRIVPELKKFTLQEGHLKGERAFVFNREVILDVPNLDDDYSIKINLWVDYQFKGDDILEYEEGTIKILFSPKITTTRISAGLEDLGGIKSDKSEGGVDVSDDEVTRIIYTLDKFLDGTPDEEDKKIRKKFYLSKGNLSIDEYEKALVEVRKLLNQFDTYIHGKYGIKIL